MPRVVRHQELGRSKPGPFLRPLRGSTGWPTPTFHISEKPREETVFRYPCVVIYYRSLKKLTHAYLGEKEWKQVEGKAGLSHCQLRLCTNAK